jgi:hypothetical protein
MGQVDAVRWRRCRGIGVISCPKGRMERRDEEETKMRRGARGSYFLGAGSGFRKKITFFLKINNR